MAFESMRESEEQQGTDKSSGLRWVLLSAFAIFASLTFLVAYSRFPLELPPNGVDHPSVGTKLSVLQLEPFIATDQSVTHADLAGHVTLINYWGPWCPPCRMEMPHIAEIEEKYRSLEVFQLFSVVCGTWVYSDLDEMRTETEEYRDKAKLDFPIYMDHEFVTRDGLESDVGLPRRGMGYPTTVLLDKAGNIAGLWEGYSAVVPAQITVAIDQLVAMP